jgi:hypothetical protein
MVDRLPRHAHLVVTKGDSHVAQSTPHGVRAADRYATACNDTRRNPARTTANGCVAQTLSSYVTRRAISASFVDFRSSDAVTDRGAQSAWRSNWGSRVKVDQV